MGETPWRVLSFHLAIELTVWNPNTRRTNTIKAILEGLVPKKKPDPEEYSPEE
ncbi:MAG: hypothetical protein OES79_02970 [Planctomycetota bacterium]|nr:hypothetical protein [Planctomycetota bacterium]